MTENKVVIPNCLDGNPQAVEELVSLAVTQMHQARLVFDMHPVDFVNPYGALLLLATSRHIAENTGCKVRLENLGAKVHAYLERMDLFTEGDSWLFTVDDLTEKLNRNPASSHLLEITRLTTISARTQFQARARNVLSTWLPSKSEEINEIVTVLSEICGNAAEHSQDQGHVMIQRYVHQDYTEVDIVVIDLGIGIKGSLRKRYRHRAKNDVDYINLALDGHSARGRQKGGAGLQIVQRHVANRNGELAIRSGSGLVRIVGSGRRQADKTLGFPGTQVSLKLRADRA